MDFVDFDGFFEFQFQDGRQFPGFPVVGFLIGPGSKRTDEITRDAIGDELGFESLFERGGADDGFARVVGGIFILVCGNEGVVPDELLLEGLCRNIGEGGAVLQGDVRGGSDSLSHDRAGRHDASACKGGVRGTDIASGEQEIGNVAGIQTAEGDGIKPVEVGGSEGRLIRHIHAAGRVNIDGPSTVGDGVLKNFSVPEIGFRENMRAQEASGFAFGRDGAHPVERPIGGIGMIPGIFDVVPNPESDPQEFVADHFIVLDGVVLAAPFEPPISIFVAVDGTVFEILFCKAANPGGGKKRAGRFVFFPGDQNRAAERVFVGLVLGETFSEVAFCLASDVVVGSSLEGEFAVTGTIGEK